MVHGFNIDDEVQRQAKKGAYSAVTPVDSLSSDKTERVKRSSAKAWKPVTLRLPYLSSLVLITLALIAIIQWLLFRSRADQGILFASDINDLSLRTSFLYLYLPTLISVIYSFLWTWVDLDVKRLEPYFQLSKPDGATAENSILLHYPFDFLASVPLKAVRRKHWSVFATSMIMVLVFWGLTPIQAGIFAVNTIVVEVAIPMNRATNYTNVYDQGNVTAVYQQSAYNIAWLNETLPPYMTKDFVLAAFGSETAGASQGHDSIYVGTTTLYSVDLSCEVSLQWNDTGVIRSNSTSGCSFGYPPYRPMANNDSSKPYDTLYVGHINSDGLADYWLYNSCRDTFWVRWSKSSTAYIGDPEVGSQILPGQANATSLFCTPQYYQRDVVATVKTDGRQVVSTTPIGEKQVLPADLFNTTVFEWAMGSGNSNQDARGDFPTSGFPQQVTQLRNLPLNQAYLPPMAPFALAAYQRPMDDYFDPEVLRLAYQSAYRLLFARQLVDILQPQLNMSTRSAGSRAYTTQAVTVVPGFAYAATGLLVLVLVLSSSMAVYTSRRPCSLQEDPGSIASMMDLASRSLNVGRMMAHFDRHSAAELALQLQGARLCITKSSDHKHPPALQLLKSPAQSTPMGVVGTTSDSSSSGVRPMELHAMTGVLFFVFQLAAAVAFAILLWQAKQNHGLPLPSQNTVARQVLENYIPITIATLMEPFWLVLNRLLCMLQPWEELREGKADGSKSVGLTYHSLPPQFIIFRALKAKHFKLALVCLMTVLSNGLAVALGGVMYEGQAMTAHSAALPVTFKPVLRPLNGTGAPFTQSVDGKVSSSISDIPKDAFYRAMSNFTAGTPLPAWVDDSWAYLPASLSGGNGSSSYSVDTTAYGVSLQCRPLLHSSAAYRMNFTEDATGVTISVDFATASKDVLRCASEVVNMAKESHYDGERYALELSVPLGAVDGTLAEDLSCKQHIVAGWIRADLQTEGPLRRVAQDREAVRISFQEETLILCTPELKSAPANVSVSSTGEVLPDLPAPLWDSAQPVADSTDFIAQLNSYVIDNGGSWHSDNFPSDFTNYLLEQSLNSSRLLDSSPAVPAYEDVAPAFAALYTRLAAIVMGTNLESLFEPSDSSDLTTNASILNPEIRIFISLPAFLVTEVILVLYLFTTAWLYLHRPKKFLPRLPSTIASTIAYFAASQGVRDVRSGGKSAWRSTRWGFGDFVGVDGRRHVGVERESLLSQANGGVYS
nr:hypothetical protein B0A51_08585 [Rachicladosporium sp. CCFEE 5018]